MTLTLCDLGRIRHQERAGLISRCPLTSNFNYYLNFIGIKQSNLRIVFI